MKLPTPKLCQHSPVLAKLALVPCLVLAGLAATAAGASAAPVEFDRYSFQVEGQRLFMNSGEVHPYRMPDPRQWPDILDRMKAGGLNTISIYVPWQLHEPRPGEFRFDGRFDLERFLRDARDAGLYVVVRPGPYIQSEIDGGGYPAWLLGSPGILRTVDPPYTAAWKRWFAAVMPLIARWEVGGPNRGSVVAVQVENEFPGESEEARAYMRDLVATAKADGITVPITHNDVQFLGTGISRGLFVDIVDVFGFDNYPYGFSCCPEWNEQTFERQVDTFESYYRERGVTRSPLYTAEIQGGIAPIGGDDGRSQRERYEQLIGYETVQGISLLGQGLTAVNRYMTFGGTTWGNLVFPNDGTSYDYAAPIREWGGLGPRFDDLRLISMQTATAGDAIDASDAVTDSGVSADDPDALYRVRRETGGKTLHVFLRHADPGRAKRVSLTIGGHTTKPVPLPAQSARWLLADASLSGWDIAFSTAEVLHADRRNLVLFGDAGGLYEAEVEGRRIEFAPSRRPQLIRFPGRRRVVVLPRSLAARTWRLRGSLVIGPRLVSGDAIETSRRTRVTVLGRGIRKVTLPGPPRRLELPVLGQWRVAEGTPEREPGFDDSAWQRAEKTTTHNQMQPLTSPVLAADDYGIPGSGFVWYRGRFDGGAEGICVEGRHRYHLWLNGRSLGTVVSDAEAPGPSGFGGLGAFPPVNQAVTLRFPQDALRAEGNVVSVLVESFGHNMDAGAANQAKQVRGLVSASLERPGSPDCGFTLAAGGETTLPLGRGAPQTLPTAPRPSGGIDWRLRGGSPLDYPNTSGLFGELSGWHTEGFDDRAWPRVSLPQRLPVDPGQMAWYRTSFELDVPRGVRAPLGLELPRSAHPADIYLNGVHVARAGRDRLERFVLPAGVLRPRGENTLAIARWNVGRSPSMARPELFAYELSARRPVGRPLVPRRGRRR